MFLVTTCFTADAQSSRREHPLQRALEEHARRFPRYRESVPHGVFAIDPARWFALRASGECARELTQRGIVFRSAQAAAQHVPDPVEVQGPIGAVEFVKLRPGAPLILACELVVRLVGAADVLRSEGIHRVHVLSAYRRTPASSFHTRGLALDVTAFDLTSGEQLVVERDFARREDGSTCAHPTSALTRIACRLAEETHLSTVITPNYGRGHDDHFHLDVRPVDARWFIR